jgi:hypothetical protein
LSLSSDKRNSESSTRKKFFNVTATLSEQQVAGKMDDA